MGYNELEPEDVLSCVRVRLATIAYSDILLCSIWAIHKIRQTPVLTTVMSSNGMTTAANSGLETAQNGFIEPSQSGDPFRLHQEQAIEALKTNEEFMQALEQGGIPWGRVVGLLKEALPETMDDRDNVAYHLVPKAITEILGEREEAWRTERRGTRGTTFIVKK